MTEKVNLVVDQTDLSEYYTNCDLVWMLSEAESFSRVCCEAAVFQKGLVATRCGGPQSFLVDGSTAMLVDFGDVEDTCAKTIHLIKHPREKECMARQLESFLKRKFSSSAFRENFLNIIKFEG